MIFLVALLFIIFGWIKDENHQPELSFVMYFVIIFMQHNRTAKLIKAEKIDFFSSEKSNKLEFNPEENATCQLLEISNQDYNIDLEQIGSPSGLKKANSNYIDRKQKAVPYYKGKEGRLPVAENFTKSHKNWRKRSTNCLSGEEVCVMKKERVLNLSNFLIIQSDDINNINATESRSKLECQGQNNKNIRGKNPKNLINFIKRRNHNINELISYENQQARQSISKSPQRIMSPLQKINYSCQLKKQCHPLNLTMRDFTNKAEWNLSPEYRCVSPNFRNKKVINYLKYRFNKHL